MIGATFYKRLMAIATLAFCGFAILIPSSAFAHDVPDAEAQRLIHGGPLEFVWGGAVHMLTGYDHLMFLFGVVFFLTRFWDITKVVTAFTLGHSVTLLGATLLHVQADYFLIDAVIAVSVIYRGFDNVGGFQKVLGVPSPSLSFMVFTFGLIHGLGLSARIQKLHLPPMPQTDLIERILAFNVGVELGQLGALVVMISVLTIWRRLASFTVFSRVANGALMIAGSLLFLFQMHLWVHNTYPDAYGFPRDGHFHDHQRMQEELERQRRGHDTLMPAGNP